MSKDIIIYPSGDTTNSNPFIRFSGGNVMNYIMEITDDGYIDLSVEENIVTSGLTFYVDAGNYESYSGGTQWWVEYEENEEYFKNYYETEEDADNFYDTIINN